MTLFVNQTTRPNTDFARKKLFPDDLRAPFLPLSRKLHGNHVTLMREDLLPLFFGGNKVRIAGEHIKAALQAGCDCMISYGNPSSNLCRVLALWCRRLGMESYAVFQLGDGGNGGDRDGDGDCFDDTANSRMVRAAGTQIVTCRRNNVPEIVGSLLERLRSEGKHPYYIYGDALGKGNEEVAPAAYRSAYREIFAQEQRMGRAYDYIFHASGTGTTQSGLLLGQWELRGDYARAGMSLPDIRGISIGRDEKTAVSVIEKYLALTAGADSLPPSALIHVEDALRRGYASPDDEARIALCSRELFLAEAVPSDMTYIGRAFCGMSDYLQRHALSGKQVLFIHTGATPLFYEELLSQ